MRVTVSYGWKDFGTGVDAKDYTAKVSRTWGGLRLEFAFDPPVDGRGDVGSGRASTGAVRGGHLVLPLQHARRLALAIIKVCDEDQDSREAMEFQWCSEPGRYPKRKTRELDTDERCEIREYIRRGVDDVYQLAEEFGCTPSQIAGIKAALNRQSRRMPSHSGEPDLSNGAPPDLPDATAGHPGGAGGSV